MPDLAPLPAAEPIAPANPAAVVDPPVVVPPSPPSTPAPVDWRTNLPDELRAAPGLADVHSVEALAHQFIESQGYLGRSIRPPGPEASDEQKQAFYAKIQEHAGDYLVPRPDPEDKETMDAFAVAMGRPKEAASYTAPEVEGFDLAGFDAVKGVFHSLGLTNKQAQGLAQWNHEMRTNGESESKAAMMEDHAGLQREWGMTYDSRMASIAGWLNREDAPQSIQQSLKEMPTEQIRWLHGVAKRLGSLEGDINSQQGGQESSDLAPAEANDRAQEIFDRLIKMQPSDPQYQNLVDKRMEYLKMANPGAATTLDSLRSGVDPATLTGV